MEKKKLTKTCFLFVVVIFFFRSMFNHSFCTIKTDFVLHHLLEYKQSPKENALLQNAILKWRAECIFFINKKKKNVI
jgi:hypothetical protein